MQLECQEEPPISGQICSCHPQILFMKTTWTQIFVSIAQLRERNDSACFKTKVLHQAPKPQGINISLHAVPSNDGHICVSTTSQIALNAFQKVPSCNVM